MSERPLYLFCVAAGAMPPDVSGDPDLAVVSHASLHAVVRPVSPGEFEGLEPARDDEVPAALAELVLRHDQVVRAVFAQAAVLPMRFGTGVTDGAGLLQYLCREGAALQAQLARVQGHAEWGVKWRRPAMPSPEPEPVASGGGAPGRSYLRRRQQELQSGQQAGRLFRTRMEEAHEQLARLAGAVCPGGTDPQGAEFGCAYLVADQREAEFAALAATLAASLEQEGIGMRVTGPWPPYSFSGGVSPE